MYIRKFEIASSKIITLPENEVVAIQYDSKKQIIFKQNHQHFTVSAVSCNPNTTFKVSM